MPSINPNFSSVFVGPPKCPENKHCEPYITADGAGVPVNVYLSIVPVRHLRLSRTSSRQSGAERSGALDPADLQRRGDAVAQPLETQIAE